MKAFPILFSYRDTVVGRGFVAGVGADGRALLVHEDDLTWWLYGVEPGGVAGGGNSREEALRAFQERYQSVLFDFAAEAASFPQFKTMVEQFFSAIHEPHAAGWNDARAQVRKSNVSLDGIERVDADGYRFRCDVVSLIGEQADPGEMNKLPNYSEAA